jgi:cold shock CspA family protein
MKGKMLWFNAEKGFGLIETDAVGRVHVAHSGFEPGQAPSGRCAGREVTFDRVVRAGEPTAVNVSFLPETTAGRARTRSSARRLN